MSTAEERFNDAKDMIVSLSKITGGMGLMGIYGKQEYAGAEILMSTLVRTITVLDPEGTQDFMREMIGANPQVFEQETAGLYL